MTESEAIKELQVGYLGDTENLVQAKHTAINALEKQMKLNEMGDCYIIPKNGVFEVNGVDVNLAIQKQIPKKPMISYDERVKENWCSCSVCAFGFGWERTMHYKYCPNCGQKLDFGE